MAKQTVNIGAAPNDGTGDPIRQAMSKINDNFDEIYSSYIATGSITVGNSTVNTVISNTGGFVSGNSTVNVVANSTTLQLTNFSVNSTSVTAGANVSVSGKLNVGSNTSSLTSISSYSNSGYGVFGQSNTSYGGYFTSVSGPSLYAGNTTTQFLLVAANGNIGISNTTPSSKLTITGNASISSNTLMLGSYTSAANGYTYLPNGLKMAWGYVEANSSFGSAQFASAFTTNAYSVTATPNTATATYQPAVTAVNNTIVSIRTSNASLTTIYYIAIGV